MKTILLFLASALILFSCSESANSEKAGGNADKKSNSSTSQSAQSSSNEGSDSNVSSGTNESGDENKKSSSGSESKKMTGDNSNPSSQGSDESNNTASNDGSTKSNNEESKQTVEPASSFNIHEYKKLNAFLGKYVSSTGHVNYASIKSNSSELDAIIAEFESTIPESSWSRDEKLAFWINAYNIFTIKLIVDNYPTSSITKITAKPWDKKFVKIGGTTYSLGGIENDVIRKKYNEPRVHFALNCASKSCPNLLNKAYMPSSLSSQLTAQTKAFLNDASKNNLSSNKSVSLSQIFDWYKDDFAASGGVIAFINKYKGTSLGSPKITYLDYSWDLNK